MTPTGHWRFSILRIYWDGQEQPSVECPVGDFFACGWGKYAQVTSLPVCVNPAAPSTATGRCPSASAAASRWTNIADRSR